MAPTLVSRKGFFLKTEEGRHKVIAAHHAALGDEPLGHPFEPTYRPPLPPNSIVFRAAGTTKHDKTAIQLMFPEFAEIHSKPKRHRKEWQFVQSNAAFSAQGWSDGELKAICDSINELLRSHKTQTSTDQVIPPLKFANDTMRQVLLQGIFTWILATIGLCIFVALTRSDQDDSTWTTISLICAFFGLILTVLAGGACILIKWHSKLGETSRERYLSEEEQEMLVQEHIENVLNPQYASTPSGGIRLKMVEEDVVQCIVTEQGTDDDLCEPTTTTEKVIAVTLINANDSRKSRADSLMEMEVRIGGEDVRKTVDLTKYGLVNVRLSLIGN